MPRVPRSLTPRGVDPSDASTLSDARDSPESAESSDSSGSQDSSDRRESSDSLDSPDSSTAAVYTIGHSTRTADEFAALLPGHGVVQLADVRAFPASRRLPHFNLDALAAHLQQHDIAYRHFGALGGRRAPRPDSVNSAWQHESFRGYADYMATPAFQAALDELLIYAKAGPTAIMCAEALWWQCHRRLIADALVARRVPVVHIMTGDRAEPHETTAFAVVRGTSVTYPGLLDLPE